MNYIRQTTKEDLERELENSLKRINPEVALPENAIEVPREKERGEFASTIAMQLARVLKKNPRVIAEELIENFDKSKINALEDIEIAGPGFINFKLSPDWNNATVREVLEYGSDFGKTEANLGKTYNIEFVSANPTGPMHIGNARGGAIGDVLASIAEKTGYEVTREFYINDAGNQIEKLGDSLDARFLELMGEDINFPEDGYQGEDIKERVREYITSLSEDELESFKNMEKEERKHLLSDYTTAKNIESMQRDLSDYGVDFDVWFSEKSLYEDKKIEEALKKLTASGHTYTKDNAIWFKSTDFGLEKDDVLVRDNGIPTYFLGDIAYHINKFDERDFDRGIDVWGADHHGHVARLKAALKAVGIEDKLDIVLMQLVKLLSNNEFVRLSKRKGNAVGLSELVDAIGLDAARYFFNMRSPESHFEFDLDLAISETNENPVFYVQYAHARIASLLRKLGDLDLKNADLSLLTQPEEIELIDLLSRFPEEIIIAESTNDPSRITHYAHDTASAFHTFYNAHRVNVEDIELKRSRAALAAATKQVLKNVLKILGISAPEKM